MTLEMLQPGLLSDSASEDRLPMVFLQSMALSVLLKQGLTLRCKCILGINPYR